MKLGLNIVHLYPVEMNIYGDRGNVLTLMQRARWHGLVPHLSEVGVGKDYDFTQADIVFAGGGQDRGQVVVGQDLLQRQANLAAAADAGVVMLTVCGTYQLFGRGFTTLDGQEIPGIGLFKAETLGSNQRMIGNIVIESQFGQLVGFENHSGQTVLDADQASLGRVIKGYGNNSKSKQEGAVTGNVFGTYLHGPVLPKNPRFADELIRRAVVRRYDSFKLATLDDELELRTARVAAGRPQ
jgi:CobQ-like glutamine amidotransferase family enzyme